MFITAFLELLAALVGLFALIALVLTVEVVAWFKLITLLTSFFVSMLSFPPTISWSPVNLTSSKHYKNVNNS